MSRYYTALVILALVLSGASVVGTVLRLVESAVR